jgi:hypothetical protein
MQLKETKRSKFKLSRLQFFEQKAFLLFSVYNFWFGLMKNDIHLQGEI